ncbi:hypothetical protein FSARC_7497 [Fusarium sarcochroum]|uniref:Uncharacterized protein n=1 Tax=Fusarium sarcochroum TaxID=1208366 RepID=A0A8H4X887_9HYPO|nr:hypothetical protein FSARC_7497 [Fusarium sarcochroum]
MFGPKSFQGGFAKLLASLFCLFAAIQLCIAAPHTGQLSIRDEHQLYARITTDKIADYKNKFDAAEQVPQDDESFMDFTTAGNHKIGSSGFAGCVGIVLATRQGAIVGHYGQTGENVNRAKENIGKLYRDNNDKVGGATPYVYVAVDYESNEVKNSDIVDQHKDFLRELTGQDPVEQTYTEALETYDLDEYMEGNFDEDMISGGFVVENAGGGSADTNLIFIDVEDIATSIQPNRR